MHEKKGVGELMRGKGEGGDRREREEREREGRGREVEQRGGEGKGREGEGSRHTFLFPGSSSSVVVVLPIAEHEDQGATSIWSGTFKDDGRVCFPQSVGEGKGCIGGKRLDNRGEGQKRREGGREEVMQYLRAAA